jgi:hypothetical protein
MRRHSSRALPRHRRIQTVPNKYPIARPGTAPATKEAEETMDRLLQQILMR